MTDISAINPENGKTETRDSDSWKVEARPDGIYFLTESENTKRFAEEAAEDAGAADREWKKLREERDRRLLECDWWGASDRTMTDAQKLYRQQLRDLPSTVSAPPVDDIDALRNWPTWPDKP